MCSGKVTKNMDFDQTDLVESCFSHLRVKLNKLPNLSLSFFIQFLYSDYAKLRIYNR